MTIDKQRVAKQFSRSAVRYDQIAELQQQMGQFLLGKLDKSTPNPPTEKKLIDLGCGTGQLLENLVESSYELYGIDIAVGMIEQAKRRLRGGPKDVTLICGDLEQTPFADETFDVVISNAALQWCDFSNAIREIKRITRTCAKSQILLSTFGPGTLREWRQAFQEAAFDRPPVHQFPDVDSIASEIETAGLSHLEISQQTLRWSFADVESMLKSVRRIGASYAGRDSSTISRTKYLELKKRLAAQADANGKLHLTYEVIFVSGRLTS